MKFGEMIKILQEKEKDIVCKAGFPVVALEKYQKLLKRSRYSYIIYKFDREKNNLEIVEKYKGSFQNNERNNKRDCIMCKMANCGYLQKDEKYMEAIMKLYRGEKSEEK